MSTNQHCLYQQTITVYASKSLLPVQQAISVYANKPLLSLPTNQHVYINSMPTNQLKLKWKKPSICVFVSVFLNSFIHFEQCWRVLAINLNDFCWSLKVTSVAFLFLCHLTILLRFLSSLFPPFFLFSFSTSTSSVVDTILCNHFPFWVIT